MWRKRQRYVFRKRGMGGRILWPVIGILVLLGLIWLIPWLALSSVDVEDAAQVEASKDQPEQDSTKDRLEQAASEDQAEQEIKKDQPKDEHALDGTPPPTEEKAVSSSSLSSSASGQLSVPAQPSPPVAQTPSVPSPPPPSPARVEEVPKTYLAPSEYSYYDPNYFNPGYSYYDPNYYDRDYGYYEPGDWYYQPDYPGY